MKDWKGRLQTLLARRYRGVFFKICYDAPKSAVSTPHLLLFLILSSDTFFFSFISFLQFPFLFFLLYISSLLLLLHFPPLSSYSTHLIPLFSFSFLHVERYLQSVPRDNSHQCGRPRAQSVRREKLQVRYSTVQYSTVQHSTVFGVAQCMML